MASNEDEENQNKLPMKKRDFLHSGLSEIASGREDIGTKRLKKGKGGVKVGKLKVLSEEPVTKYTKMKKLREKLKKLMPDEMEAKLLALFQEDEDKDFKKAKMERKKIFLDWVKECDETDDDDLSKNLKLLRDEAMRQGFRIADLLMIMVWKDEIGKRNFQGLIDSLKYMSDQGVDSEGIGGMLVFLEAVDGIFWKKEPKNLERFSQRNTEEAVSQGREQNVIKEHVSLLVKEIFRLELFWMNEELPHSKMSVKDEFPSLGIPYRLLDFDPEAMNLQFVDMEGEGEVDGGQVDEENNAAAANNAGDDDNADDDDDNNDNDDHHDDAGDGEDDDDDDDDEDGDDDEDDDEEDEDVEVDILGLSEEEIHIDDPIIVPSPEDTYSPIIFVHYGDEEHVLGEIQKIELTGPGKLRRMVVEMEKRGGPARERYIIAYEDRDRGILNPIRLPWLMFLQQVLFARIK